MRRVAVTGLGRESVRFGEPSQLHPVREPSLEPARYLLWRFTWISTGVLASFR